LLTEVISSLALSASVCSLVVSILTYKNAGPRVAVTSHTVIVRSGELWLEARLSNVGKGEIDVDGATCDLLGPTTTALPYRLKAASSHVLTFRSQVTPNLAWIGSVTLNVGLGNGRSLVQQLRLTDVEQAGVRRAVEMESTIYQQERPETWIPPTQEEI